jgi:LSD1 subclass zinc finger protein
MPNVTVCPACEHPLKVPAGADGRKIRCPSCKAVLLVSGNELSLADAEEASTNVGRTERSRSEEHDTPRRSSRHSDLDEGDEDDSDDRPRPRRRRRRRKTPLWVWIVSGVAGFLVVGSTLYLAIRLSMKPFDKVKIGMSIQEVKDIMGPPEYESMNGGTGTMTWGKVNQDVVSIWFENGKVTRKDTIAPEGRIDFEQFK